MKDLNHDEMAKTPAGEGARPTTDFQLISPLQLAKKLGVPPVTVYSWKRRGKIPYVQLGRCIRFDQAEIQAWLQSCKRGVLCSKR
jgi:excisionase family DNA binding protein